MAKKELTEAQFDRELDKIATDKTVKLKQPKKKEAKVKNLKNNSTIKTTVTVIVSVAITLGVVYAAYSLYQMGHAAGVQHQKSVDSQVTAKIEQLKK